MNTHLPADIQSTLNDFFQPGSKGPRPDCRKELADVIRHLIDKIDALTVRCGGAVEKNGTPEQIEVYNGYIKAWQALAAVRNKLNKQ